MRLVTGSGMEWTREVEQGSLILLLREPLWVRQQRESFLADVQTEVGLWNNLQSGKQLWLLFNAATIFRSMFNSRWNCQLNCKHGLRPPPPNWQQCSFFVVWWYFFVFFCLFFDRALKCTLQLYKRRMENLNKSVVQTFNGFCHVDAGHSFLLHFYSNLKQKLLYQA